MHFVHGLGWGGVMRFSRTFWRITHTRRGNDEDNG